MVVLRVVTRCRCGHQIPVRVAKVVVEHLRGMAAETVVATYACRRCGVVEVKLSEVILDRRMAA